MASDHASDPGDVPPLWVRWVDVPELVAHRFGIDLNLMAEARRVLLIELLSDSSIIEHRVQGHRHRYSTSRPFIEQLRFAGHASAYWTSIGFDPVTGTVARQERDLQEEIDELIAKGVAMPGESADAATPPARTHVEVYWPSVQTWFEDVGREKLHIQDTIPPMSAPHDGFASTIAGSLAPLGNKLKYDQAALAGWYILRVRRWPPERPGPTEEEDLRDARGYFDRVPRDALRKVRNSKAPAAWKKPGPGRQP